MKLTHKNPDDMNWYLAKIIYQIICGDGRHTAQFDEQLRLIQANDELEAFHKARQMGEDEQETFFNSKEKLVQWKFVDVSEVHKLDALIDGAEIYSRINEEEDADVYVKFVKLKAAHLMQQSLHKCFQNN
jgi:hypothetical protein